MDKINKMVERFFFKLILKERELILKWTFKKMERLMDKLNFYKKYYIEISEDYEKLRDKRTYL